MFVLSHPLGNLGVTYTVHLWLAGKRVVDFLLAIIEFFASFLQNTQEYSQEQYHRQSSTDFVWV